MIRTAIAICALAAPMQAATVDPEFVRFQGDPEAFVTGYNAKGMPFFHKPGPYTGPMKGEAPCRATWMTTPYNYVCKPKPRFVDTPDAGRPPMRAVGGSYPEGWRSWGYPLSAGTWQAGHADAAGGYGDSFYAASDYQIEYVSYFTETTTITVEGCGCKHEPETPPPVVPLPASAWMLIAALGMIAAIRKGRT